jgi:drug/metabolite transporter (DMT)-like permease
MKPLVVRWTLVGLMAICNSLGDVLNTAGMKRWGELEDLHPSHFIRMIRAIFHNSLVLAGLSVLAISFFALLALLSIANVSFAVPATAASYLLETVLSKYVLKETITWRRWLGASFVACGVALLSL